MWDFLLHHVIGLIGLGGVVIVGLAVVAWFIPGFRLLAIEIAGGIIAASAIYLKGASDAQARDKARQTAAENAAVASGKADRAAADRDAAGGVRDGFDTDNK